MGLIQFNLPITESLINHHHLPAIHLFLSFRLIALLTCVYCWARGSKKRINITIYYSIFLLMFYLYCSLNQRQPDQTASQSLTDRRQRWNNTTRTLPKTRCWVSLFIRKQILCSRARSPVLFVLLS